jgi:hypothetical protein
MNIGTKRKADKASALPRTQTKKPTVKPIKNSLHIKPQKGVITQVEFQEKYNGLVLKATIFGEVVVKLRLTLSRCMMPSYWKFAFLSRRDVMSILDFLPARDVWLLGLGLGVVSLSPSIFKTAYAHLGDILITSKAGVITRILQKYEQLFEQNQQAMLDTSAASLHHVPALPKFFLYKQEYTKLSSTLTTNFQFYNTDQIDVKEIFDYREDTKWIAIAFEGDCLHALRLVPYATYIKARHEKQLCVATKMPLLTYKDQAYAILCDDGALFGFC